MDTGLVSFVLARLKVEWKLTPDQIAAVGSAGLVGMFLGGAVAGALADRYGRKAVFQATLLAFSIATGLCALSWSFASLLVLRLLVGFGLGGELPVAAALVSELAPARHRGRLVVLLESFWAFGWVAAAIIADVLARHAESRGGAFPWRIAFLIGALPAFYVFVLRRSLPESPRYLEAVGRHREAEAIVSAMESENGAGVAGGARDGAGDAAHAAATPLPATTAPVAMPAPAPAAPPPAEAVARADERRIDDEGRPARPETGPRAAARIAAAGARAAARIASLEGKSAPAGRDHGLLDDRPGAPGGDSRADPGTTPSPPATPVPASPPRPARFADLFRPGIVRRTTMLWILWFTMAYSYYGIFIWLPSLLVGRGYPEVQSFHFTLWITLAQIPGYFAAAWLVEKLGRKPTLVAFMLLCAAASFRFGGASSSADLVLWGCLVSFFNLGAWGVTYGYTPELYPTWLRGTGTGFAAAFGRIGGILAPLAVGRLIGAMGGGFGAVFTMFAGVLAAGALGVLLLGEETRGRTLEEISG